MDIIGGILLVWSYVLLGRISDESKFWGWVLSFLGNISFVFWTITQVNIPWGIVLISSFATFIAFKNAKKYLYFVIKW